MFILLSLLACLVVPQSGGGDDTDKHSGAPNEEVGGASVD